MTDAGSILVKNKHKNLEQIYRGRGLPKKTIQKSSSRT
jgi:hypothetical protein